MPCQAPTSEACGFLELKLECLRIHNLEAARKTHEQLPGCILHCPTLDGRNAILRGHRLTVVPKEPVAQRERVRELVAADLVLLEHLRPDLTTCIGSKQCVVDHIAV